MSMATALTPEETKKDFDEATATIPSETLVTRIKNEEHINRISGKLVPSWRAQAYLLKLNEQEVHAITQGENKGNPVLQSLEALRTWLNKVKFGATYENLIKICIKGNWTPALDEIIEILAVEVKGNSTRKRKGAESKKVECPGSGSSDEVDAELEQTPRKRRQKTKREQEVEPQLETGAQDELSEHRLPQKKVRLSPSTEDIPEFSTRFNAKKFADWMGNYYLLPKDACKVLLVNEITGFVFSEMDEGDIDKLGFKFAAKKTLVSVLKKIKQKQEPAGTTERKPARGHAATSEANVATDSGAFQPEVPATRTELTSSDYAKIVQQLMSVKNDWEAIATALVFKPNEIANIRGKVVRANDGNHIFDVIEFWLRWGPGDKRGSEDVATLEALQTALNDTDHATIKLKLKRK